MLRLLKNNTFRLFFAGLAMILAITLAFLPRVFAADPRNDFSLDDTRGYYVYSEDGSIEGDLALTVTVAGDYTSISGSIYPEDDPLSATGCEDYMTLSSFQIGSAVPTDAIVDINGSTGSYSIDYDAGMNLSVGDEILKLHYLIPADAPAGSCEVNHTHSYSKIIDGHIETFDDTTGTHMIWSVSRKAQSINYDETEIDKEYGDDDFTNPLTITTVKGAITYSSDDESVATVNVTTGEVHIVGVGTAHITATAATWYEYVETSDVYTLNVDPKEISISSANVPDKTYDGTTNSEVGTVTLSETGLVQGTDYTVSAVLDDANVGDDRVATVTVTLAGDAATNYTLASNTIDVDNVTVSPYTITSDNIALEYYLTRYSGTEKEPGVTVNIGTFTVDSNEYTVGYEDNVDVGTATVTVTAKDNMNIASSATKTFEIIDKDVLSITGIATPQTLTYTGDPVALVGTLTVGDNTDGITVNDLTTIWYVYRNGSWEVTTQPVDVGIYKVIYSYDGVNYVGELEVYFEIEQAISPEPTEASEEFSIEAGKRLSEIDGIRTLGFAWDDEDTIVERGKNTYLASYVYNNDSVNYTTLHFRVTVEGLYTPEPEPTPVDPDTGGDEETIVVPDTGRFTSVNKNGGVGAEIVGIMIIAGIAAFMIGTGILERRVAKNKINFNKK